ncbi:ribonuclease Z [Erwinia sp. OLTSP20]|uniref:ribonuclease Z n=1 Tax=unclassified Erwinia TaxID=2622719 RepID=UPI000C176B87|nr:MULTISPECIES: ribonuclease Z [unclassified Erwinia]PIJ50432.1 ribonuclease Z [Erwinia sp. OAMSP11]PIJ72503.1 ribonuclease Z [Erwinia sp. OLSSP12]PIJ81741.1 ribonuclease Z [Erwinia sp. OLCASP19]PIJ84334.1 ribonuclease Z [Erwinia sp. OLMTSP26]PIJ86198.1 ribonuclease Z [Erwinia sp. OLMDSP33]
MQLQFLGTGAGMPSRERNVTSIALNLTDHAVSWLFDCGEGTQHQILRTTIKAGRIEKIFITHLHGDHIFGLPGLLTSRSMSEGSGPLTLYGPAGLRRFVETTLSLSGSWVSFPMEIIEISAGVVCEDERFRVMAAEMNHPVECYGYRIEEKDKPGALDDIRLAAAGVPRGPWFYDLKQGRQISLADGRVINGKDYLLLGRKGKTLVIFGDTSPNAASLLLAKDADLIVHEATLEAAMEEKANGRGHSSTVQAARVAQQAAVRRLIITHLSSRYQRDACPRLLAECRAIFPATEMAHDFALFSV